MKELTINRETNNLCSEIKNGLSLLNLARGWLKQGNTVVAIELLKSALNSEEAEWQQDLRAQILKETGRAMMMQSEWESAEYYYLESQRLYLSLEHYKGASECARNRANMYFQKGKYSESEKLCELALEWASLINDHELRATILNTLAAINSASGNLREAIKTFKLCLSDFQSSGNIIRQGYVLLNIGLTHTELGEYTDAISNLNQSLAIALDEKDLSLVEICYQNIAKCYLAQKETNLAQSVIDTARKILPGLNSKALEAELNLIDCKIKRLSGDFESTQALLERTFKMAEEHNLNALKADILFEQGLLNKNLGKLDLAISKLDAAANLYRQIGVDKGFKQAIMELKQLRDRLAV